MAAPRHASLEVMDAWSALVGRGFPEALAGQSVDGVDLLALHSRAAGCVDLFIRGGSRLDAARARLLRATLFEVTHVRDHARGAAHQHFAAVADLLELVSAELFGEN